MKNVTFYLIDQQSIGDGLADVEQLTCKLAAEQWRQGKLVLIACKDNAQALRLDEALWEYDPNAFVPHNLAEEGLHCNTPIEICWPQHRSNTLRNLLISLLPICADFASNFHEVIDFVPGEGTLKQLARARYKAYRSVGFQLITIAP